MEAEYDREPPVGEQRTHLLLVHAVESDRLLGCRQFDTRLVEAAQVRAKCGIVEKQQKQTAGIADSGSGLVAGPLQSRVGLADEPISQCLISWQTRKVISERALTLRELQDQRIISRPNRDNEPATVVRSGRAAG
jgi:hypothetical protein